MEIRKYWDATTERITESASWTAGRAVDGWDWISSKDIPARKIIRAALLLVSLAATGVAVLESGGTLTPAALGILAKIGILEAEEIAGAAAAIAYMLKKKQHG